MARRILIVDDSKVTRWALSFVLNREGYDCVEVCDGTEALAALSGQRVDMIITDLWMPEMNGFELIRSIRDTDLSTPVLVLTTDSRPERKAELEAAGASGLIQKPFQPEQILDIVREYIA